MERDPSDDDGRAGDREQVSDEEKEARERSASERNPDPLTRRETLELDLMEDDRSEAGEQIGDELD